MKLRVITVLLVMIAFCSVASAQSYAIRVTYNTNLRAADSLTSGVVDSAPAGTVLTVVGQQGGWLQIDRNGRQVWMAGWVSHSRVQSAQPAAPQNVSNVDNCCFVDRQCHTDQEWADGYWAFQNGQCAAPAQSQPQTVPQPQTQAQPQTQPSAQPYDTSLEKIDNCCHLDRECHSEEEWRAGWLAFKALECWDEYRIWWAAPHPGAVPASGSNNCCTAPGWICNTDEHFDAGYRAYRDNSHCSPRVRLEYMPYYRHIYATDNCCDLGRECHSDADWQRGYTDFLYFRCSIDIPVVNNVPVQIQGRQAFVSRWIAAFSLLKAQSPRFYDYAIAGLNAIKEGSDGNPKVIGCGVFCGSEKTVYCEWGEDFNHTDHQSIAVFASIIVHEACHCHREEKGYPGGNKWEGELPCEKAQGDLMKELDPGNSFGIPWDNVYEAARKHGVTDLRY